MPGSLHGEYYEMPLEDALAVLMALNDALVDLNIAAEELDELRRAARTIVDNHAADVVRRYASNDVGLRVVKE
jgi:hypothetical protein